MTTAGGGWTVFQRRINNMTDFYQDWNNYKQGFGEVEGNFWLGLEALHQLTADDSELYIYMEADHEDSRYAHYATFNVGAERDNYRLTIGNYSGNAGDSLTPHNRQMFTTKDKDNDIHSGGGYNCAQVFRGAWWYYKCHTSNLNGLYLNGDSTLWRSRGIVWGDYKGHDYSLKYVKMMLRRKMI
jgi:ficolin